MTGHFQGSRDGRPRPAPSGSPEAAAGGHKAFGNGTHTAQDARPAQQQPVRAVQRHIAQAALRAQGSPVRDRASDRVSTPHPRTATVGVADVERVRMRMPGPGGGVDAERGSVQFRASAIAVGREAKNRHGLAGCGTGLSPNPRLARRVVAAQTPISCYNLCAGLPRSPRPTIWPQEDRACSD